MNEVQDHAGSQGAGVRLQPRHRIAAPSMLLGERVGQVDDQEDGHSSGAASPICRSNFAEGSAWLALSLTATIL